MVYSCFRAGSLAAAMVLLIAAASAHAELPSRITRVLDGLGIPYTDVSILIEEVGSATPVLAHLPGVPRNPASVMKLVTTWSALDILGPAWVWPTEVYYLGSFDGTTLRGDIGLKGYGDPFLVQEELWKLLRRVRNTGLQTVTGDLVFDDSYFDVREPPPGEFDNQPTRTYKARNSVRIALEPPLRNLRIDNGIDLGNGRCGGYQRGISFNVGVATTDRVVLDGEFSRSCSVYTMSRTVLEHDSYGYGLFRSIWGELGGRLEGDLRHEAIDEGEEPSLVWTSRPLADVVRSINKNSNNVMTRQLLYTLGAAHGGAPGTRQAGIAAISEYLQSIGLDIEPLNIVNGAGLSREARLSARLLVDMLQASHESPYWAEFASSLSIGGVDGTTRGRYDRHSGNGRTHVKTGRLDDVSALAGFAHHSNGVDYVLTIFVNTPDAHRGLGNEVEEAVLAWLFSL
jgi:D-alanyl-D-alanine carboxypeptidase/D-alanyl-D-alanine-endopeptidase (penicillin-binding protein 4)